MHDDKEDHDDHREMPEVREELLGEQWQRLMVDKLKNKLKGTGGRTDGRTDGRMGGRTDRPWGKHDHMIIRAYDHMVGWGWVSWRFFQEFVVTTVLL